MSTNAKTLLTAEQYLEIERHAEYKSEFYNGEMFAMAGAAEAHNQLVWNLISQLARQIGSGSCRGYPSDMRVRVSPTGLYSYPDVVVVCGEPQFLDDKRDTLLNPTLITAVLSPSTEGYDRGRKFEHYRSLTSLCQYLLISSDRIHIDLFTRQPGGEWLLRSSEQPEETVELESVNARVGVAELYTGVEVG